MKILFDCTYLRNKHTGVDVYFFNLVHHLLEIDKKNDYIILVDTRYDTTYLLNELKFYTNYTIKAIYSPLPLQVLYAAFLIPFYLKFKKIAIYHNPYFFGPIVKFICNKTKIVITVHDLYHRTVPQMMNKYLNVVFRFFADSAIKKANEVIVISTQTQTDVIKYLQINESKLNLIYQALDRKFDHDSSEKSSIDKFNLKENSYVLAVGKILPSKGFEDLVRAFKVLIDEYQIKNIKLVIAGMQTGQYIFELEKLIDTLGIDRDMIILPGYVSNNELTALYTNCNLLVSPSHYEGFGFPVLEGMRFGKPVIARNASSLIEIVDDAGLLFNSVNELASQIKRLLIDNNLRSDLIKKGAARLKAFSWTESAKKTLGVYLKNN